MNDIIEIFEDDRRSSVIIEDYRRSRIKFLIKNLNKKYIIILLNYLSKISSINNLNYSDKGFYNKSKKLLFESFIYIIESIVLYIQKQSLYFEKTNDSIENFNNYRRRS